MVEQGRWNSDSEIGGTVKECLWNSVVEQWKSGTVMVEQCWWNSDCRTVRWNSGTVLVEQCGGIVEQCWWNSGTVMVKQWNSVLGTVELSL